MRKLDEERKLAQKFTMDLRPDISLLNQIKPLGN